MIVVSRAVLVLVCLAWVAAGAALGLAAGLGCRP